MKSIALSIAMLVLGFTSTAFAQLAGKRELVHIVTVEYDAAGTSKIELATLTGDYVSTEIPIAEFVGRYTTRARDKVNISLKHDISRCDWTRAAVITSDTELKGSTVAIMMKNGAVMILTGSWPTQENTRMREEINRLIILSGGKAPLPQKKIHPKGTVHI